MYIDKDTIIKQFKQKSQEFKSIGHKEKDPEIRGQYYGMAQGLVEAVIILNKYEQTMSYQGGM